MADPQDSQDETAAIVLPDNSAALQPSVAPRPRTERIRGLVDAFLRGRKASTLRAYATDLDHFAAFLRVSSREAAATHLFAQEPGEANAIALTYRNYMVEKKLGSATINRRLASLRSFSTLARMLGLIVWKLEVESVPHESYTDIFGPGTENVGKMVDASLERGDAQGVRDAAILRLLFDRGLRRGEIVTCDFEHYHLERGICLLGKGKTQRVWYALPKSTHKMIQAWLRIRGEEPGPLFTALNDIHCGHRLTGNRIWAIVRELGEKIGVRARPHGLRHSAISEALDKTNGNVRMVQQFSRHADVKTVLRYDDARRDDGFQTAELVASALPSHVLDDAASLVAMCGRGHVHVQGAAAVGKFCMEGECFFEAGKPLSERRIEWRAKP